MRWPKNAAALKRFKDKILRPWMEKAHESLKAVHQSSIPVF
jgi:hypothetical protein